MKNNNKPANTTIVLKKTLRDDLMGIKYKYKLEDLNQVIQLLYIIRDEDQLQDQLTEKDKELLLVGVNHKSELGEIWMKNQNKKEYQNNGNTKQYCAWRSYEL